MVLRRALGEAPSQAGESSLEGDGIVEDLDDPELPPVVQLTGGGVTPRVLQATLLLGRGLGAQRVHEEDAPAGPERGPDEVPERLEAFRRDVREPEPEEHTSEL